MAAIFRWPWERKAGRDAAVERALLSDAYREVFRTPDGQRVLADILRRARVLDTVFDASPTVAAYGEGMRRVGLEIVQMINEDPDAMLKLAASGQTEELFPHE